ncbi:porin family protein [Pseudofulvibacter geojedonensis]|uniref:Porin family protein n=1 Tax=Pseudofulvibacter geojedonensis TaxID=1123758 RepID=A0ABW3I1U7_9FLAO
MKNNKLLLIVLGLFLTIQIYAQNDFKIGINAGINYPKLRGNEYAKYNNFKVGYLVGVSFDYYIKQNLSLKTNINYERKIKKLEITLFSYDANVTGKENYNEIYEYINLPILLKYEFGNSKFFANGGPFFNYLINQKIDSNYSNNNSNLHSKQKKIDFGLSLGIGTNISLNEKNDLTIEIRDDLGLIDTSDASENTNSTLKTNSIKLIIGWNIGI